MIHWTFLFLPFLFISSLFVGQLGSLETASTTYAYLAVRSFLENWPEYNAPVCRGEVVEAEQSCLTAIRSQIPWKLLRARLLRLQGTSVRIYPCYTLLLRGMYSFQRKRSPKRLIEG